jgi:hypothetical protein
MQSTAECSSLHASHDARRAHAATSAVGCREAESHILPPSQNIRTYSWIIAHDFQHSGQFFATSRMCTNSFYKTFGEVFIDFWTLGYPFRGPFRPVRCIWKRELRVQTEARMMHFVTLTVPPPRTDHSSMHNSTRAISPGQKGL